MPDKKSLTDRVTDLECDVKDIKDNQYDTQDLADIVLNLKKSIDQGHFCKWNVEMGKLEEFQKNTVDVRKAIFKSLENHHVAIEKLIEANIELTTSKDIMTEIKTEQKAVKTKLTSDRRVLLIALGSILATVLSGRLFELIWFVFLGHN